MTKKNEETLMFTLERIASILERIEMQSVPEPKVKVKPEAINSRYVVFLDDCCKWLYTFIPRGNLPQATIERFRLSMMDKIADKIKAMEE